MGRIISKFNKNITIYKEGILFSLFFFILFFFQTKTINTGDAGELVTASYGLGIAHPSGYPIYLIISKFFSFLPFGNIPTKVALVSSISSSLIIFLVSIFFKKNKFPFIVSIFYALIMLSCYSFFGQSLISKFYPLNTLLIFIIFWLGYESLNKFNLKNQFIISFLLGLSLGLHHTTYLMFIPLLFLVIIHFRNFIRNLPFSIFLFVAGASCILYLMIRSWKPLLLNMSPSGNLHDLAYTLMRKAYGNSSSPDVAKSLIFLNFHKLFYAIKNSFLLLYREFYFYSFIFFVIGFLWLLLKDKKRFFFIFLTFISYSIILAYITFSSSKLDINSWYICANQYYMPLFVIYALICSFGFFYIVEKLPDSLKNLKYIFLLFPIIYFPQNIFLNFYDKNNVAYYKTIDSLFVKPIKSIVIYSGDNDVFQGWYEKNVEKFRDDICLLSAPTIKNKIWGIANGCNKIIYKDSYPAIFKGASINFANFKGYIKKNRLYSSMPIESNSILNPYFSSNFATLDFLDVLKDESDNKKINKWLIEYRKKNMDFIHFYSCLTHSTDDVFSKALCIKYANYLVFYSYDIGYNYEKENKLLKIVNIFFDNKTYKLNISINKKNRKYLYWASQIIKYNNLKDYYLFTGDF